MWRWSEFNTEGEAQSVASNSLPWRVCIGVAWRATTCETAAQRSDQSRVLRRSGPVRSVAVRARFRSFSTSSAASASSSSSPNLQRQLLVDEVIYTAAG